MPDSHSAFSAEELGFLFLFMGRRLKLKYVYVCKINSKRPEDILEAYPEKV